MENKILPEFISKAKQAKTPEELIDIAKVNNIELSSEEAQTCFNKLNKSGELTEDELSDVTGGGCGDKRKVVTSSGWCKHYVCNICGRHPKVNERKCHKCGTPTRCCGCIYCTYEGGNWRCNNPANMK